MRRINTILIILFCAFLSACSDFLEEKSQDEVLVKSVQDYEELLLHYTDRSNRYIPNSSVIEFLTDDVVLSESLFSSSNAESSYAKSWFEYFTWQPNCWLTARDEAYKGMYRRIAGINAVLDGIDEATGGTFERKELVKAKALALRADCYFYLVNIYGEPYNYNKKALGVPLKLDASILENGIPRNTVEDVYIQVIDDLTKAIGIFEKYEKKRDPGMNITSSHILLSRVYLYMEEWEKSVQMATEAIKTSLGLTDYTEITSFKPSYSFSEVEWVNNSSYIAVLNTVLLVAPELKDMYEATDQRKVFWITTASKIAKWNSLGDYQANQSMRISEAYLNRMEAYILQNQPNTKGALDDLNLLRRNRIKEYTDVSISDPKELLIEVRNERRKELCFDGHRWFDLRRYGMPAISHRHKLRKNDTWKTYTLQEKDQFYTLPIPEEAFENNVLLEQHSGVNELQRDPNV